MLTGGLKSIHLGKTLGELQPTLLRLVIPSDIVANLRMSGSISMSAAKAESMKHLSLIALSGQSESSCSSSFSSYLILEILQK
jgi:hypothetical protein